MSYKYSKGAQVIGDLQAADDRQRDTKIDFEEDYIGFHASGSARMVLSGSKVGIGTTSPDYRLQVAGNIGVNEYIYHNGDNDTYIRLEDDEITLNAGGRSFINLQEASTDKLVINNGGLDIDLQVKGEGDTNLIRTDAANDRVGIGTSAAIAKLDVAGKIAITSESSTPSQPSDGQGYLYTKSDGKIYWRSYDVSETDLTSGGAASAGGPDGAVQINDSNSLTGSGGFTYDGEEVYASGSVRIVGDERINDPSFADANERKRSFTFKRHYQYSGVSANTWHNVIIIRPYLTGTTNDPSSSSFWATVGYRLEVMGNVGGVGTGYRSRVGSIQYNGSSAGASSASDTTLDSPISVQVSLSGWTATIQINANQGSATNFTGVVYLEMYFTRGQGSAGNSIEWSLS